MTTTQSNRRAAALLNTCWPAIVAVCWFTGCGKPAATPEQTSSAAAISQPSSPEDAAWIKQAEARLQQDREAHEQWAKQDGANAWALPDHIKNEPTAQAVINPADPLAPLALPSPKSNVDYLKDFEARPVGSDASSEPLDGNPGTKTSTSTAPKASFDDSLRSQQRLFWLASSDAQQAVMHLKCEPPRAMEIKPVEFTRMATSELEVVHCVSSLDSFLSIESPPTGDKIQKFSFTVNVEMLPQTIDIPVPVGDRIVEGLNFCHGCSF